MRQQGLYERREVRRDARHRAFSAAGAGAGDVLTPDVAEFLIERDSCCVATVSETGWPYVQFRGGPPGFLQVTGDHAIG